MVCHISIPRPITGHKGKMLNFYTIFFEEITKGCFLPGGCIGVVGGDLGILPALSMCVGGMVSE